jgi:outer membrane receptor protein involved in Fe transport
MTDLTPASNFKISGGARLDAYDYDQAAGLPSEPQTRHPAFSFSSVNPRAAIVYKPYEGGNLKILGSKGFRAPSVYELFWITSSGQTRNDALQPENVYSAEIEYSHRITPTVVGLVSVYTNYITNLIAQRTIPTSTAANPVYQYVNTDVPVAAVGVETEVRRDWKEGWMYSLSYSLQRSQYLRSGVFSDYVAFAPNPSLREVPNSPTHLVSARGAMPLLSRALTAMSRVSFVSGRYARNDAANDPRQTMTNASVIWDLVLSGSETKWGIRYALGLYNIFDWREQDPVSAEFQQTTIPQAGRTLLLSLNATLK